MQNIVVKLSSNLLNPDNSEDILETLARDIAALHAKNHRVIIVTSGAVMYGLKRLGKKRRKHDLPLLQSAAAIGQIDLMNRYQQVLGAEGLVPAQILLSKDDFNNRMRYLNLRNTLESLLEHGIIPVFNENDSINTEELKFGDNDHISALIALLANFDSLILLSDVDGLYDRDPKQHPNASLIEKIEKLDESYYSFAGESESEYTSGGMQRKLESALMAVRAGTNVFIGNGFRVSVKSIVKGKERGTYIKALPRRSSARKRWLGFTPSTGGSITIDEGASRAIRRGTSSLLPVGICGVEGIFEPGDLVSVMHNGRKVAQGLTNYSSGDLKHIVDELRSLAGNTFTYTTEESEKLIDKLEKREHSTQGYSITYRHDSTAFSETHLPYKKLDLKGFEYAHGYDYREVIHRDNLFIL
jgi:glutamate 5-kinase